MDMNARLACDSDNDHVEFGMYAFAHVRWAWESLWAAVHDRAPWTPPGLAWSGDTHARWDDDSCVITQVCGGPFVAKHQHHMILVGAFVLDLPDADDDDAHYHAVLLSPHDRTLAELVTASSHVAVNSLDSLTGWLSLRAAAVGPEGTWPGTLTVTGSHHDSVRALAAGQADLASIDPWSLAFIEESEPELLQSLHRVGVGPRIPTPPIAIRSTLGQAVVPELRAAISDAFSHSSTVDARAALHIASFVTVEVGTYLAIEPLISPG